MKEHTPGPWDVFGAQDASSDEWRALTVAQKSMPFMRVCFMPSDGTEEIIANATLIAAAPDLLAFARQSATECAECMGKGISDDTGQDCEGCADIRALISKATGNS